MTDPISDFLTRLRNASKAKLAETTSPHSTLRQSIAAILKSEGYIADYKDSVDADGHKTLYSEAFYDRATFDQRYGGDTYRVVKERYDPDHRLTGMFEKVVERR